MSAPTVWDAIVVGAGPAGSVTALLLAAAGRHVLLLDRRKFPRAKPCGDCLSAGTGPLLDRLGLLGIVEAERPARLRGWRIVSPGGRSFLASFADAAPGDPAAATALALPRELLDRALLRAAQDRGVTVRHGFHATDVLRGHDGRILGVRGRAALGASDAIHARLVVGADGLRSTIARRLGLLRRPPRLRKVSLTAHVRGIRDVGAFGEMHLAPRACAGLAPVSEGPDPLCNLTLVVDADANARAIARDAEAFFHSTLRGFPRLAGRLDLLRAEPAVHNRQLLASGPFDWPTRDIVADGAALVGDAAGYFDPFTGQGIHLAIAGAELLATAADTALRAGDVSARRLRPYARRYTRLLREARALQHVIEFAIARPRLADAAIGRLARSPRLAASLIAATGDLRPARSLAAPGTLLDFLVTPRPKETNP